MTLIEEEKQPDVEQGGTVQTETDGFKQMSWSSQFVLAKRLVARELKERKRHIFTFVVQDFEALGDVSVGENFLIAESEPVKEESDCLLWIVSFYCIEKKGI